MRCRDAGGIAVSQKSHEALSEAVARHCAAVISLRKGKGFEHHRTRFLAEDPQGVWLANIPEAQKLIGEIIVMQSLAAVAFKAGPKKAVFAARILRHDKALVLASGISADAILLHAPDEVEGIQGRGDYRVDVAEPAEAGELSARLWRIAENQPVYERPSPHDELTISIRDLSVSGVGLFCAPEKEQPVDIRTGQRLRIQISHKGVEVAGDAEVRHVQVIANQVSRVGLRLCPLDQADLEKQRLSRLRLIIDMLRREEMRRLRAVLLEPATTARSPAA